MATNPMQRKARNSFILGVIATLIVAAIIIAFLWLQMDKLKKANDAYVKSTKDVYVLSQDVKSGQILTANMFMKQKVPVTAIPSDANAIVDQTIQEVLKQRSYSDTEGHSVYFSGTNYYIFVNGEQKDIYTTGEKGDEEPATILTTDGNRYYYYAGANKTDKKLITVRNNTIVAKIDLQANTVLTTSMLARGEEITTDDLREQEYNVISLPVDLMNGEYIDIRLLLPTGEDYIVASKKKVSIPMSAGVYLADTIKVKMTEQDILTTSCAIVENFQIEGSKLYATRYTEAGLQETAKVTYRPSTEVVDLITKDPNAVTKASIGITENRNRINAAISDYGDSDKLSDKVLQSITSDLEARKQYLQTLQSSTTTTTTNVKTK